MPITVIFFPYRGQNERNEIKLTCTWGFRWIAGSTSNDSIRRPRCPSGFGPHSLDYDPPTKLTENIILNVLLNMDDTLRSSAYESIFLILRENGQEFSLMSGERSFFNLFRDSRTPLDSIRDKLLTLIYFVIVQCLSVGTTWYSAS